MTMHPNDRMDLMNAHNGIEYHVVGESGAKIIYSALTIAPTENIWRVLDFGCGHGRIARHLRGLFPSGDMYFLDIDPGASQFCAAQFGGEAVQAHTDFSELDLPNNIDLIWLGSVFTHIDDRRIRILFDKLTKSLSRGGILVGTFHGSFAIKRHAVKPMIDEAKWKTIMDGYESSGIGWAHYDGASGAGDWGLSLTSPGYVMSLAEVNQNIRLVGYFDKAWANFHDVAIWTRL